MSYSWREWKAAVRAAGAVKGVIGTANALVLFADHATGETRVGHEALSIESGYELGTTINHLRWLVAHDLVHEVRRGSGVVYVLNTPACESHGSVEIPRQRARQRANRTVQSPQRDASVRSSRGIPYDHQDHQDHQTAGSRAPARPPACPPARVHAHESRPADEPTSDPPRTDPVSGRADPPPDAAPAHDPAFAAEVADRALGDAAVQRAAVAVRAAYEAGVEAGHPGCAGDGTLDDAAAMVRWALEHLGEHPALLPGMSLADVERLLCDVAREYGAWRARPDGKASGGTRYLRPKPLRYLGSPGRDGLWSDLRAQLDRAVAQRQAVAEKAEAGKASATAQTVRERVEATRRAAEAKAKADARAWAERNGVAVADDGGDELVPEAQTRRLVKALTGEVG